LHDVVEFISRPRPFRGAGVAPSSRRAGLVAAGFSIDVDLALQQQLDCSGLVVSRAPESAANKVGGESHGEHDAVVAGEGGAAVAIAFKKGAAA
jgi:hypothetical protein